jgi:hypothetical protein
MFPHISINGHHLIHHLRFIALFYQIKSFQINCTYIDNKKNNLDTLENKEKKFKQNTKQSFLKRKYLNKQKKELIF